MNAKPTMIDVAKAAQVALGTVSKVLSGDSTVTAERRERVLAACEQLSYQRNAIAASLRSRQTHTIGIVIPDILNTFYATLLDKLENLASSAGYTVVIVTAGEDTQREIERIDILRQRQVDGIIVVPSLEGSGALADSIDPDLPCVVVDRISQHEAFPSVATDNVDAAYQGTRYLLSLGHRHIVLAVNSPDLWNTTERIMGFRQAIDEANARGEVRVVGMTVDSARQSLAELFAGADLPSALFTANNLVTLGAVGVIQESRLQVPGDLSLLAFDDFEWLRLVQPPVSAVAQPINQIAVDAWRLMFQQLRKRPLNGEHVRAGGQLVIRQSTGAPGRQK